MTRKWVGIQVCGIAKEWQLPMKYSSRPRENVLDLLGGSWSTLIAAAQTGRQAFWMELDPLYCDVIVQRFEQLTGRNAERVVGMESGWENEGSAEESELIRA